jgi:hypothetical protein
MDKIVSDTQWHSWQYLKSKQYHIGIGNGRMLWLPNIWGLFFVYQNTYIFLMGYILFITKFNGSSPNFNDASPNFEINKKFNHNQI